MSYRMIPFVFCTVFLALATLTPAHAGQDGNPFEGFYVGFNFNYAKVQSNATYSILDSATNTFGGIDSTKADSGYGGIIYGGFGSNAWGPIYLGIEAGLGLNGGTGSVLDSIGESFGAKAGFSFDVSPRVGVVLSDHIMLYALGGYTSIKFSSRGFIEDQSKSLGGYRYGGGLEYGIMEDVALRLEYVRTEHSAVVWTQAGDQFRFDPSTQVFRIGLVLHMD